jgi:hypothetical protein
MKKLILLISCIIFIFSGCKKSNDSSAVSSTYEKKNKALFIELSETWCPGCGSYGGPLMEDALRLENTSLTCMKVCLTSVPASMNSNISMSLEYAYQIQSVPDAWMNTTELYPGGGIYLDESINYSWITSHASQFDSQPVIADILLNAKLSGSTLRVDAKVKFYSAQNSGNDFKLAVYVLEDYVKVTQNTQSGAVDNYIYRNLLRAGNSSSYAGETINNAAAVSQDQEFSKSFDIPIQSGWVSTNLKVIGVLWKFVGSSAVPTVVNSNICK